MRCNRRRFIRTSLHVSLGLLASGAATAQCIDEEELSDSVRGMRESLEYTDAAPDASRACSGCSFFQANSRATGCGSCEVLSGPVNAKGHCVSWTKRS